MLNNKSQSLELGYKNLQISMNVDMLLECIRLVRQLAMVQNKVGMFLQNKQFTYVESNNEAIEVHHDNLHQHITCLEFATILLLPSQNHSLHWLKKPSLS